jgi:hypothetical protein
LVSDPLTWMRHKSECEEGARAGGKTALRRCQSRSSNISSWAIGTDPAVHIKKMHELFDGGVSIVNVHSGQPDQKRVMELYGMHVLPALKPPV